MRIVHGEPIALPQPEPTVHTERVEHHHVHTPDMWTVIGACAVASLVGSASGIALLLAIMGHFK